MSATALTVVSSTAAKVATDSALLVQDVVAEMGGYLDDPSVLVSVKVCRIWRDNLQEFLAHVREDEHCRRVGYRSELVQALRSRHLSLWRLPVLDLQGRMGDIDYIDFLKQKDVNSPLMRFEDKYRRVGLAVKLRGKADGNISWNFYKGEGDQEYPIRQMTSVLAVFQRYTDGNSWVPGVSGEPIYKIYNEVHRPHHQNFPGSTCPSCSPFLIGDVIGFSVDVIAETDAAMKIDGEIEQVVPALLPPMPPKPVVEKPLAAADNAPISIPRRIWNAVTGFFLWIASLFSRLVAYCRGA